MEISIGLLKMIEVKVADIGFTYLGVSAVLCKYMGGGQSCNDEFNEFFGKIKNDIDTYIYEESLECMTKRELIKIILNQRQK